MNTKVFTLFSVFTIVLLTYFDLGALLSGIDCIGELGQPSELDSFGIRLCVGNFFFKLTGLVLATLGLIDLFRGLGKTTIRQKLLWSYTAIALVLTLPLYHPHGGFGGSDTHPHSFWDGGLHFH